MYCEYTDDISNDQLTLQMLYNFNNNIVKKNLILIFSAPTCGPCKQLAHTLKSIYENLTDDQKKEVPNTIKLSANLLSDDDLRYIKKYPTVITIENDQINKIDRQKPMMEQLFLNNDVNKIVGLPQMNFYDQHKLTVDF